MTEMYVCHACPVRCILVIGVCRDDDDPFQCPYGNKPNWRMWDGDNDMEA